VHFALDRTGDVYLTGRLPFATWKRIDTLLGCVLATLTRRSTRRSDRFRLCHLREWHGAKRGSLANLRPFADLVSATENRDKQKKSPA
jgi:hypothetical protein